MLRVISTTRPSSSARSWTPALNPVRVYRMKWRSSTPRPELGPTVRDRRQDAGVALGFPKFRLEQDVRFVHQRSGIGKQQIGDVLLKTCTRIAEPQVKRNPAENGISEGAILGRVVREESSCIPLRQRLDFQAQGLASVERVPLGQQIPHPGEVPFDEAREFVQDDDESGHILGLAREVCQHAQPIAKAVQ